MNPLVVLKLLDLAALAFTAWGQYDMQKKQNDRTLGQIDSLRNQILAGTLSDEQANMLIDNMIAGIIKKRKEALKELPGYEVNEL